MAIAIKRYQDKTYIPLSQPWSRRIDYGDEPVLDGKKKKGFVRRIISKTLDNAANGIIRGTGNKPMY